MFGPSSKRIKIERTATSVNDESGGGASGIVETQESIIGDAKLVGNTSTSQGPVTYKLISPASGSSTTAATVLTAPMSGQFYVIGNPSEVVNSGSSSANNGRIIAPKATLTIGSSSPSIAVSDGCNNSNSSRRIDRRRATHNEVERRRRDTINAWIMQLGKLIPGLDMDDQEKGPPKGGALSKGGILAKACDFVQELSEDNKTLEKRVYELEGAAEENERLLNSIEELRQENTMLKQQLENHGIVPSSSSMDDILS